MTPTSATLIPSLNQATERSRQRWAADLRHLLDNARSHYADVEWVEDAQADDDVEDAICAHKAIIYVRASKAFKDQYFAVPDHSARGDRSLSRQSSRTLADGASRPVLRLPHHGLPELLRSQLEWLYTAQGGIAEQVTNWIADDGHVELESGEERLSQDLTYVWRSKLYADCVIRLDAGDEVAPKPPPKPAPPTSFRSPVVRRTVSLAAVKHATLSKDDRPRSAIGVHSASEDESGGAFSAHRFILCSRSPYFAQLLLHWTDAQPREIHLPSPPFTSASLHFIIGYIYSGNLTFSNRTLDLGTAFAVYRGATYLELDDLVTHIESYIAHELCHGIKTCQCRKCLQRIPRVWVFAVCVDGSPRLAELSRQYIVGHWGDCLGKEVAAAPQDAQTDLCDAILQALTVDSLVHHHRQRLRLRKALEDPSASSWAPSITTIFELIEKALSEMTIERLQSFTETTTFRDLLDSRMDIETLESILDDIVERLGQIQYCKHAPLAYQTIVGTLLLAQTDDGLLVPSDSRVRQLLEEMQTKLVGVLKRRWMQVRPENGFEGIETWALKEIADGLDVEVQDLLPAKPPKKTSASPNIPPTPSAKKAPVPRLADLRKGQSSGSLASTASASASTMPPSLPTGALSGPSQRQPPARTRATMRNRLESQASLAPPRPDSSSIRSRTTSQNSLASLATRTNPSSPRTRVTSQDSLASTSTLPRKTLSTAERARTAGAASLASSVAESSRAPKRIATRRPDANAADAAKTATSSTTAASTSRSGTGAGQREPSRRPVDDSRSVKSTRLNDTRSTVGQNTRLQPATRSDTAPAASNKPKPASQPTRPPTLRTQPSSRSIKAEANRPAAAPSKPSLRPLRLSTSSTLIAKDAAQIPRVEAKSPGRRPRSKEASDSTDGDISVTITPVASEIDLPRERVTIRRPSFSSSVGSLNALEVRPRGLSISSSTTSAKFHPALAFDPPRRDTPTFEVDDDPIKHEPESGIDLHVGIPCIFAVNKHKLKAYCRYIGLLKGQKGVFVGLEISEQVAQRNALETGDGTMDGRRYFKLTPRGPIRARSMMQNGKRTIPTPIGRPIPARTSENALYDRWLNQQQNDDDVTITKSLFVRPKDVVFVLGAD